MKKARVAHSRGALGLEKRDYHFHVPGTNPVSFGLRVLEPGETVVLDHLFARCEHEDCAAETNPWMMFRCVEASLARGEMVTWKGFAPKGLHVFRTVSSDSFDLLNIMFNYSPVAEVLKDAYAVRVGRECVYEFMLGDPWTPLVSLAFVIRNPWKTVKRISFSAMCSSRSIPISDDLSIAADLRTDTVAYVDAKDEGV